MRLEFLTNHDADRLILIFAGWGSDAHSYSHIHVPGWDVAVVWGIGGECPDFSALHSYDTIYVYAWSLGVWVAESVLPRNLNVVRAYAINGTPWPCSDTRGIPVRIFRETAATLDARNLHKFRVRMCGGLSAYREVENRFAHVQDIERLQCELQRVLSVSSPDLTPSIRWDIAFVGSNDMIFPPANQSEAWKGYAEVKPVEAHHYFDLLPIVSQTAVNVVRVGKRFNRSLTTYESHAHAQRLIAETLAEKTFSIIERPRHGNVAEIGPGTGLYTRQWSKHFNADEAVFVDVCDMPQYGVAVDETYFQADAEPVMSQLATVKPQNFAAVFSASAIQWLSNLPTFFANCAKVLCPDGFISMSTFAPGNLHELTRLRPDHLQYVSVSGLTDIIDRYFDEVYVEEDTIELEFSTPLEALRHLQLTGVTTSGSRRASVAELRHFAETFPMNGRGRYILTFRPIYIVARKPNA